MGTVIEQQGGFLQSRRPGAPRAGERMEAARPLCFDHTLTTAEVETRTGIGQWVMRRAFGPRGTPAFGLALQKLRSKT